jgi:hypothetical protein
MTINNKIHEIKKLRRYHGLKINIKKQGQKFLYQIIDNLKETQSPNETSNLHL